MFEKQLLNGILTKGFDLLPKKPVAQDGKKIRYERIKDFLLQPNFNGFTKDDLFIMQFIKKGWGHDIAAAFNPKPVAAIPTPAMIGPESGVQEPS